MELAERSVRVDLCCAECGCRWRVTRRHARRVNGISLCPICAALLRHSKEPVLDRHRSYWLRHFSDEEIADLASKVLDEMVPVERVRERWPRSLLLKDRL